jgi:hypothetical protein
MGIGSALFETTGAGAATAKALPNPCHLVALSAIGNDFGDATTPTAPFSSKVGKGAGETWTCSVVIGQNSLDFSVQSVKSPLSVAAPVQGQITKRETRFGSVGRLIYASDFTTLIFATNKYWMDAYYPAESTAQMLKFGSQIYRALSK